LVVPYSRIEWAEMRLDHIEAYREEHPLPRDLDLWRKQVRRILLMEKSKVPGQRRLEDFLHGGP